MTKFKKNRKTGKSFPIRTPEPYELEPYELEPYELEPYELNVKKPRRKSRKPSHVAIIDLTPGTL